MTICDYCSRDIHEVTVPHVVTGEPVTIWADESDNRECAPSYEGHHTPAKCLDAGPGPLDECQGEVTLWHSGGMSGRSWPRCTYHGERRLKRYEDSIEQWADSDVAPGWFDPSYAGERWDDDY